MTTKAARSSTATGSATAAPAASAATRPGRRRSALRACRASRPSRGGRTARDAGDPDPQPLRRRQPGLLRVARQAGRRRHQRRRRLPDRGPGNCDPRPARTSISGRPQGTGSCESAAPKRRLPLPALHRHQPRPVLLRRRLDHGDDAFIFTRDPAGPPGPRPDPGRL